MSAEITMEQKRARYEAALAKLAAICEAIPGDSPFDMKKRIMAAVEEFGVVRSSTALSHLNVRQQCEWRGPKAIVTRGFRHFCEELIADGLPVYMEWRLIKSNPENEEPCLVLKK